ncbi:MAG: hypothetical protein FJ011_23025 [Chloroflexi bacterium]|nr:hypothetical protein [Chloroflexota bacterium]
MAELRQKFGGLALAVVGILVCSAILAGAWRGPALSVAQVRSTEPVRVLEASASAPAITLHYQGRLLDPATGQPKRDGSYGMMFRLYDVETGGAALWTESQNVAVANGAFNAFLGSVTALNQSHFDGRALWLGVTVGADPEATPRQVVAYAPYALFARNAAALQGNLPTAFAAASHTHSGATIVDGTIAAADLADGAVTTPKIAVGNVTNASLAANSVSGAKVADGSLSADDIADRPASLSFPASVLSYEPSGTTIQAHAYGLLWQPTYSGGALLAVPRPEDWTGNTRSEVVIHLFFYPTTGSSGMMAFFARACGYNPGDTAFCNPSYGGESVPARGSRVIAEQVIPIPASVFADKSLWWITFQRVGYGSGGETYPDPVVLVTVRVDYEADR